MMTSMRFYLKPDIKKRKNMKIVPIEFAIAAADLTGSNPESVEASIKEEILKETLKAITPMLDDENFIDMSPSEDGKEFIIKVNMMVGSTSKYIDATAETTKNLLTLCLNQGVSHEQSKEIIRDATKPLIDLVS